MTRDFREDRPRDEGRWGRREEGRGDWSRRRFGPERGRGYGDAGREAMSEDGLPGTPEEDFGEDFGTGVHRQHYSERVSRPGSPRYGEDVGYLDRGWSGGERYDPGERPAGDYATRRRGDYRGWQGGFSESEAGRATGTGGSHDTPDWPDINAGRGGAPVGWYGREGGPHRGRGPRGYQRSDERIREEVHDRLSDDEYVDATDVTVTVSACEVTLDGFVDDRHAKRRAEDVVESVSGVRHVQNNLRVRDGRGGERPS